MKANELRIRNLALDKENNIFVIIGILGNSVFKEDAYIGTSLKWIKPIPLTEEWLLKFGFISDTDKTDNYFVKLKYGTFYFQSDLSVDFREVYLRLNNSDIIVEFVHQLQNLYFALTGEELTIKD